MCVKVPVWYQKRVRMLCIRFHVIVVVLYHCRILCILHNHVNTQERASAIYSLGLISLHKQRRTQRSSPSLFLLLPGAIEHRSNTRVRRARRAGGERARGREGERARGWPVQENRGPQYSLRVRGAHCSLHGLHECTGAGAGAENGARRAGRARGKTGLQPCGGAQAEEPRPRTRGHGPRARGQGPGAMGGWGDPHLQFRGVHAPVTLFRGLALALVRG